MDSEGTSEESGGCAVGLAEEVDDSYIGVVGASLLEEGGDTRALRLDGPSRLKFWWW